MIPRKSSNIWKFINILLNNSWIKEITGKIRKRFKLNDNDNTYKNVYDTTKTMLGGKFIPLNAYVRKE